MKSTYTLVREMGTRARAGSIEHYVEVRGTRVRYLEAGSTNPGPPLVMLHGFRAGADYWFPHTLPALAEERHVIALDLPGYGYSGGLAEYDLSSYATFMIAFLDALGLQSVNLLGHSMGAQVAIATAAKQPERVE